jgi:hypothetical protein
MSFSGCAKDAPRLDFRERRMKYGLRLKCAAVLVTISTLPTAIWACVDHSTDMLRVVEGGGDTTANDSGVSRDATLDRSLDSLTSDAEPDARVGVVDVGLTADDASNTDADASTNTDDSGSRDAGADASGDTYQGDGSAAETSVDGPNGADGPFEAEAGATTDSIVAALGPDCLSCATTNVCFGGQMLCESFGNEVADAGPAAGQTRQQLCLDTLSCIVGTNCPSNSRDVTPCYCAACTIPLGQGACRNAEERGLETTVPSLVLNAFYDPTLGAGMANTIVQCLLDSNCSCFPAGGTSDGGAEGGAALDGGDESPSD